MKSLLRNKLLSFSLLFLALAPLAAGCGSQMGSHGDLSDQEQTSPGDGQNPGAGEVTPAEPGAGEETPAEPGAGEATPAEPGAGEATPAEPGAGEETPAEPGEGEVTPAEPGEGEVTPAEPGEGGQEPGGEESATPGESEQGSDGAGEESEKTPKEKVVDAICKELKDTCSKDCDKAELERFVGGSGECLTSLGDAFVQCIKDTTANQCSSTAAEYYTNCASTKLSEQCFNEVTKDFFPKTPQDEVAEKICAALNSKCGADACTDSDSVKEYVHGKGACLTAYGDAFVKQIEGTDASQCSKKNMLTSYLTYAWGSLYGTACYDEISAEM